MHDFSGLVPDIPPDVLAGIAERLGEYDPADLAAAIGGLQLLPENAGRAFRLEVLAHLAASAAGAPGCRPVTSSGLDALCNRSPLGTGLFISAEDPFDNPFTEAFSYYGGSYTVFPGVVDEITYVLRHLATALFWLKQPFPHKRYATAARYTLHALLIISDEIAKRASLGRGVPPASKPGGPVIVPNDSGLRQLKACVTFPVEELASLLGKHGIPISTLNPLTLRPGSIAPQSYSMSGGPLLFRPFIRTDTQYIVPLPGALLDAARHSLVQLANSFNVGRELAERFRAAVWHSVVDSLHMLGNELVAVSLPGSPPSGTAEGVFSLDLDKALYVMLAADPIDGCSGENPRGHWPQTLPAALEKRVGAAESYLLGLERPPRDVLSLVVVQGTQRLVVMGSPGPNPPGSSPLVTLSAADLETISRLDAGDELALWNFAEADRRAREHSAVLAANGELDKYAFYRGNNSSFYFSDEERPDLLNLVPGGAGDLRREAISLYDPHAAPSFQRGYYVDVVSLHGSPEVPIYAPRRDLKASSDPRQHAAFLVEGLPLPVWVVGPDYESEQTLRLRGQYLQLLNAIAYWLWQFSPFLNPALAQIADRYWSICLSLEIQDHAVWHNPGRLESLRAETAAFDASLPEVQVSADSVAGSLAVTILPPFSLLLHREDNTAERELMRRVLAGVRDLVPTGARQALSEEAIGGALDISAPIGQKRMVVAVTTDVDPQLDPSNLPPFRRVSSASEAQVLDDLGEFLLGPARLGLGPVPDDARIGVLDRAVEHFYSSLQELVASLDPGLLLEFLIAQHESVVYEVAEHHLTMPTRSACYSHDLHMLERFAMELQELASAGMASRFVMEYVAACPPKGKRPVSIGVYERLLSLANQIINYGFARDLVHNGLANIKVEMLPSRRLGMDRAEFDRARQIYVPLFTTGYVARTVSSHGRYWKRQPEGDANAPVVPDPEAEAACRAEFGYTLTDVASLVSAAMALAHEQGSLFGCMSVSDLVPYLAERLDWDAEQVRTVLDSLTLSPRDDFLAPEPPFGRNDVYPWRFNRRLSYLRRPFLLRYTDTGPELLWGSRHLYGAWEYLVGLCRNGRLQATSEQMARLMGKINKEHGADFNDEVALLFEGVPGLVVRRRVGKSAGIGYPEASLGDIDVLVVDPTTGVIKLVECKDLAVARTPQEMALERKALFEGRSGKKSAVEKLLARVEWIRGHIREILDWLGIPQSDGWVVEAMLVVDTELITPYLGPAKVPVVSLQELKLQLFGAGPGN